MVITPGGSATVNLVVQAERDADLDAIITRLQQLGFQVEHSLPKTGIIGGTAPRASVEAIRALPHVAHVKEAGSFHAS